ncbi:MAG: hypothetical protein JJU34_09495 [Lunatimonas sp.]|uniref:hypothetical protein n=1 Tax=Lunatimonas sp. TaxID=2060141 RepID=UPI00263B9EDC|nr:hypothetical protein [Lunatimonas sp.]MCC5937505.1 hypothetical protein [Lunatimonas sp.]
MKFEFQIRHLEPAKVFINISDLKSVDGDKIILKETPHKNYPYLPLYFQHQGADKVRKVLAGELAERVIETILLEESGTQLIGYMEIAYGRIINIAPFDPG